MVKFKDFSRPLSVFQVLFKANLIFKDFSRQSCIFKYLSSLCEPCCNNNENAPLDGNKTSFSGHLNSNDLMDTKSEYTLFILKGYRGL